MSIPVLHQVYGEVRRLAVAGGAVAPGDFRLKKLLPALDQAAAKAPVFAKIAEAARAVVNGTEETVRESLLELASLATAVMYTQGETGIPGQLEPIEPIDLGVGPTPLSGRFIKQVLTALSSTGSGRLDVVKEAFERGAFRDYRLVQPALDGLDDPYQEVADFLAGHVVPTYGRAVWPLLRAKYDPRGARGDAHRLTIMRALDPAGTRDLVHQALESGSKEVKVAAVACLGDDPEDICYLIEQLAAKARDVRRAAYRALARSDAPQAVAALRAGLAGKEYEPAAEGIALSSNPVMSPLLAEAIRERVERMLQGKDPRQTSGLAEQLVTLVRCLPAEADRIALELFDRREELARAKGDTKSGSDVFTALVIHMYNGSPTLQAALARAHAKLASDHHLNLAFLAALQVLPPAEVYDQFAPYLTGGVGPGKGKGNARARRDAILSGLRAGDVYDWSRRQEDLELDPRWQDLGVKLKHLGLLHAVGRPGHKATEKFLQAELDAAIKTKDAEHVRDVVAVMVRVRHPSATATLIAGVEKNLSRADQLSWYVRLVPWLPKSAIPALEALTPKFPEASVDHWLDAIQELREQPD